MLQRTEGIVLKTTPFGEADLIVTYLTSGHGILKTFAKSPRKTKSRFGSSLEPLTYSRISFWGKEEAALPRLTQSDILHTFQSIRSSLKCFLKVCEMIELTMGIIAERDAGGKVHELLLKTLHTIEADCNAVLPALYYKLKLLEIGGFLPGVSGCGRCGGMSSMFYLSYGTVLCDRCSRGAETAYRLSQGTISLFSNLIKWEFSKINRIKPGDAIVNELSAFIDEHVRHTIERNLRTKAFTRP